MKLRRHYGLILILLGFIVFLLAVLGNKQIIAYSKNKEISIAQPAKNYENNIQLFDDRIIHQIKIIAPTDTKKRMIKTYQVTGSKDFFAADIIIDGQRINNIGIRLKGNASLRSVAKADSFFAGAMFLPPELKDVPSHCWAFSELPPPPGLVKEEKGTLKTPFLIRFDEFVTGQSYLGYKEFAVRTSGVGFDAAQLQEPITNYALSKLGLAATKTAYINLQFDNEEKQLYTISEVVNQKYIDAHFPDTKGILYKVVQVGNDFKYLGSDLSLYANIFEQKTAKNQADLTPLTKFMDFVSNSSKQEFDSELENWLDSDNFAEYLAIENLLVNFDSLAGMGNNYYLYFDEGREKFTILAWDANESLGKLAKADFKLDWSDRFTPPAMPDQGPANKQALNTEMPPECAEAFAILEEKLGPPGSNIGPPQQAQNQNPNDPMGPFGDGKHVLKDRFLESPKFQKLYQAKLREAYQQIFVEDLLSSKIIELQELVNKEVDFEEFDNDGFNQAVAGTKDFLEQRFEYLHTVELLNTN